MINLKINNYKCLENFEVSGLKRVNLFTGKNNTGKSTILEAISLLAVKGNLNWMRQLLEIRGEVYYRDDTISVENNINILSSFFSNREVGFSESDFFKIYTEEDDVTCRLIRFIEEEIVDKDNTGSEVIIGKRKILTNDFDEASVLFGFEIKSNNNSQIYNLDKHLFKRRYITTDSVNFHLINSQGDNIINSAKLWDKITLSEKEQLIIDALKIIEPDINRLSFVGESNYVRNSRYPIVKLNTTKNIYPLKAMGDGINRILNLVLALVNSDGGYLLIDECENGLHHSIQDKLWEIIFETAEKLNVQVFATTHSNDTINSFAKVLERNNRLDGALFRLERKSESVIANSFSKEEITIASNQGINLR